MELMTNPGTSASSSTKPPEVTTVAEKYFSLNVSCLSWNKKYDVIALGGNEIRREDCLRVGKLYLVVLNSGTHMNYSEIIYEESQPPVFDLKWESIEQSSLVLATSNSIRIFDICNRPDGVYSLQSKYECFLPAKPGLMALSIEWITQTELIYSDTTGVVTLLGLVEEFGEEEDNDNEKDVPGQAVAGKSNFEAQLHLSEVDQVALHDSIIWAVHYSKPHNIIFTGAGDGTLIAFHRSNFHKKNRWLHEKFLLGITAINTMDDILAVGSFDNFFRIYTFKTTSDLDKSLELTHRTEINLESVVKRIVWLPYFNEGKQEHAEGRLMSEYKIAVAAGENGIHLLSLKRKPRWVLSKHLCCLEHKAGLAYGLDVKVDVPEKSYTVASCFLTLSALHVWKTDFY